MIKLISSQTERLVASLIILVISTLFIGCTAFDQPPVIYDLTASAESVNSSDSTQITCDARDPDRDELTYSWSASGGTISGEGSTATWAAPAASGAYTIKVTVSDGRGGEAKKEVSVDVLATNNTPPFIKDVVLTPPSTEVWDDETLTLTCVAVDPDGDDIASYTWSVKGETIKESGTIEGNGATAVWKPPKIPNIDQFTISVYVTDSKGNRSRAKFIPVTGMCECIRESGGKQ
jgi:hypothetical protein